MSNRLVTINFTFNLRSDDEERIRLYLERTGQPKTKIDEFVNDIAKIALSDAFNDDELLSFFMCESLDEEFDEDGVGVDEFGHPKFKE